MPAPSTAIERVELGATYSEFDLTMSRRGFIGHNVMTPRMTPIQAATVPQIPLEQLLQSKTGNETARAPGSTYSRGRWEFDQYKYATQEYGWEEPVDDREAAMYRDFFESDQIAADRATDFLLRQYEVTIAGTAMNTSLFATTAAAGVWTDVANGVPISDMLNIVEVIEDASGISVNGAAMDRSVFRNARETDQIVDRLKFWGGDDPKAITVMALAEMFELRFLLVAGIPERGSSFAGVAIQNTAPEGGRTLARIWDQDKVFVGQMAMSQDPRETCIGRTLMWSAENAGIGGDDTLAVIMEQYREEVTRSTVTRARMDYDIVPLTLEAGRILTGVA